MVNNKRECLLNQSITKLKICSHQRKTCLFSAARALRVIDQDWIPITL